MTAYDLVLRKLERERHSRLEAERVCELKSRDLYLAKLEAEEASRAKSEFLRNTGHELRTPLSAILGFTSLLIESKSVPDDAPEREYLSLVHDSAKYLLTAINQVLDMARLQSGGYELNLSPCAIGDVVRACMHTSSRQAIASKVRIATRIANDVPWIVADSAALTKCFLNLIDNAIKFSPAGGEVTLEAGMRDGTVEIVIADQGAGIPAACLARVTEPFFQVDGGLTRRKLGTGLGLAIARGLLEAQGGELQLTSTVGLGTTVRVLLPGPAYTGLGSAAEVTHHQIPS